MKKILLVLVVALLSLAVAGCGSSSSGGTATTQVTQETNGTTTEGEKVTVPEERPTFICKVKEIVGNEVTVYKANSNPNQGAAQSEQAKEAPKESAKQGSSDNQATNQTNQTDQGARAGGGGPRMSFSEETETFLIPVGVPIVTMQRGTKEVTEVGLTQIKKDTILQIWQTNDEITFVQVAGGGGQRMNNNGGNQNSGAPRGMNGPQGGMGPPPGM